jgi:pimeloyl-ACP methyl ester carboxylesterase
VSRGRVLMAGMLGGAAVVAVESAGPSMVVETVERTVMTNTLKVPGATLYYESRGSGPVLLMIPGGPADAGVFASIVPALADRYRVVTCDPRGNSRSSLDGSPEDWSADIQADDAHRLLAAVGNEPAYVFGNSSGAFVALALAARHPEQVRVVVAHEAPAMELLPDRERHRDENREIYELYKREGVGAAMARFLSAAGLARDAQAASAPQNPADPATQQMMARVGKNFELFIARTLRQAGAHVPDFDALRSTSVRVIVAAGEGSRGRPIFEASEALTRRLGATVVHFPGDHGGFTSHPGAFAKTLNDVLRAQASTGPRQLDR